MQAAPVTRRPGLSRQITFGHPVHLDHPFPLESSPKPWRADRQGHK